MVINFEDLRKRMVEEQLVKRGIGSEAVLNAMLSVPRHLFVPEGLAARAYDDSPLSIGHGQTISQPYIVAYMTEQLQPAQGMKILEIGTGSGYQAAVLAQLGCKVYTVELIKEHAERAVQIFSQLNLDIKVKQGNGYLGWEEETPFDAAIITAAPENIPEKIIGQLKDGGRMIVPVGPVHFVQHLKLIIKKGSTYTAEDLLPVRFVPMVRE